MSDTRARASLFARWLGSFERNGLSGRLAPPSLAAPGPDGGGDWVRGGVAGREPPGIKGGAAGAVKAGDAGGVKGGAGGGGVNAGNPEAGEGGVAVAATDPRSTDSCLGRAVVGTSTVRGGGGGEAAAGRCTGGPAGAR
ncbi:MAG: hypothetical protein M3P26_10910 [Gemmatimonadota bacterium]|nr:hypothetical protein [Gemmatimonadota bacterium]